MHRSLSLRLPCSVETDHCTACNFFYFILPGDAVILSKRWKLSTLRTGAVQQRGRCLLFSSPIARLLTSSARRSDRQAKGPVQFRVDGATELGLNTSTPAADKEWGEPGDGEPCGRVDQAGGRFAPVCTAQRCPASSALVAWIFDKMWSIMKKIKVRLVRFVPWVRP